MNRLNRFNWIAQSYDRLVEAVFGESLDHAQMHFVKEIGTTDHVLILGGGSGKFLMSLLEALPSIQVTYVEASSEMIALAKAKVGESSTVKFIHGTEEDISIHQFDIVITNFFLDLFRQDQLKTLVRSVFETLKGSGKWLVTDFENTDKLSHRFLLSVMYLFFRISKSIDAKCLPIWKSVFANEGLKLKDEKFFRGGFVSASVFVKE